MQVNSLGQVKSGATHGCRPASHWGTTTPASLCWQLGSGSGLPMQISQGSQVFMHSATLVQTGHLSASLITSAVQPSMIRTVCTTPLT